MPGALPRAVLAAAVVAAAVLAQAIPTGGPALGAGSIPSTPEAALSAFVAAFNGRDAASAAAAFSSDAELLRPDDPPARGRPAIAAALHEQFRIARVIDLLSVTVTHGGRQAVASGRLTMSAQTPVHGADNRSGNYVAVLRRTSGRWEITHLIYTLPLRPDFVG